MVESTLLSRQYLLFILRVFCFIKRKPPEETFFHISLIPNTLPTKLRKFLKGIPCLSKQTLACDDPYDAIFGHGIQAKVLQIFHCPKMKKFEETGRFTDVVRPVYQRNARKLIKMSRLLQKMWMKRIYGDI